MKIKNILPLFACSAICLTSLSCGNSREKDTKIPSKIREINIEPIKDSFYSQYQQQESIQAENLLKRDSIWKIYQTKREQIRESFNKKIKYLKSLKQKKILNDNEYKIKISLAEQEFKIILLEIIKQWCKNYSNIIDEMK